MNGVGEVRAVLAVAADQLGSAYRYAGVARAGLAEAVAALSTLGEQHGEPLVPVELRRAADELERSLALINSCAAGVADIDARL